MLNALGTAVKQASGFTPYDPANIGYDYSDFRSQFILNEHTTSVSSTLSGFSTLYDHSRSGNATMVDSDGVLKWAPHNLLAYSENGSKWASGPVSGATVSNGAVTVNGAEDYAYFRFTAATGLPVTVEFDLTSDTNVANVPIRVADQLNGANEVEQLVTLTAGVTTRISASISLTGALEFGFEGRSSITPGGSDEVGYTLTFNRISAYRSDLGGMVDNPDRGDSYVPTTSTAKYLPRLNHYKYNGSAWVNKGVLVESEARTNLVTYSNDFTNAAWVRRNTDSVTVTPSQAVGADGATSLSLLAITDTTNEDKGISFVSTLSVNTNYTFSVYVKNVDQRFVGLWLYGNANHWAHTTFDLNLGVVTQQATGATSGTIVGASIQDIGGGLYRISMTAQVADVAATEQFGISFNSSGTPTLSTVGVEAYAGVAGTGLYVGSAQLETGSVPSSYIPTSGATATRAADTLTIPYEYLPQPKTNALSIQMKGEMDYADEGAFATATFVRWRLDASNLITNNLSTNSTDTGRVYFIQVNAGVTDQVLSAGASYSPGLNVPFNIASRHGSTFINGAVDGTALTADLTPVALPDLTTTDLALGDDFIGTIEEFRIWSSDLGDTGISDASEPSLVPSLNLTFDGASTSFTHTELTS